MFRYTTRGTLTYARVSERLKKVVFKNLSQALLGFFDKNHPHNIDEENRPDTSFQLMTRKGFKNWCKNHLHKVQSDGNEQEWEASNFKLYSIQGIRRSERIRAQINQSVTSTANTLN